MTDAPVPATASIPAELAAARQRIDQLDGQLVELLASRFAVTRQVGQLKAERGLPEADPAREAKQLARIRALAEAAGVDPDLAAAILASIVAEVVRQHHQIPRPDPA